MEFRVGINMGDVVIEGSNLYGDGVNVAARLEALAQPGGICLSKNVHDIVHKKMNLTFTDLGDQQVKNTVVHAVDVSLEGISARRLPGTQKARSSRRGAYLLTALALVVLTAAGGLWWSQAPPDFEPANLSEFAVELPKEPSIAVVPFSNLSGDPSQDYVGDGLTENLISALSASPKLIVTPRDDSFTFKGKAISVQEIAERLGVRYVLDGSFQQSGDKLRVTAQVVDAVEGKHLWSGRYDRKIDELFEIQDDITYKIWTELLSSVSLGQQGKRWLEGTIGDMENAQLLLRGRDHLEERTIEGTKEAERFFRKAFEQNPESGLAAYAMGNLYTTKAWFEVSDPRNDAGIPNTATMESAKYYANKAYTALQDASSLTLLGRIEVLERNCEGATAYSEQAVALDRSAEYALHTAGNNLMLCGKTQEGVDLMRRSIESQPPAYPHYYLDLSFGLWILGEYEEAEEIIAAVLRSDRYNARARLQMIITNSEQGKEKEAKEHLDEYLEYLPESLPYLRSAAVMGSIGSLKFYPGGLSERYTAALLRAGMPE